MPSLVYQHLPGRRFDQELLPGAIGLSPQHDSHCPKFPIRVNLEKGNRIVLGYLSFKIKLNLIYDLVNLYVLPVMIFP